MDFTMITSFEYKCGGQLGLKSRVSGKRLMSLPLLSLHWLWFTLSNDIVEKSADASHQLIEFIAL